MGKVKCFSSGFAFGSLAAGAAVLFSTPKSGKAVRADAKRKSRQVKAGFDQIKTEGLAFKDDVVSVIRNIPAAKQSAQDIQTSIQEWQKDIQPNLDNINDRVKAINKTMNEIEETAEKK